MSVALHDEILEREAFVRELRRLVSDGGRFARFFSPDAPIGLARAPGRLDVMGGIADYSGSLVLEWPIREAAWAAVQVHPDPELRIVSSEPDNPNEWREARLPMHRLLELDAAAAAEWFRSSGSDWAAYVAGALVLMPPQKRAALGHGLRILLCSSVPEGKGVSSSAAIEVASYFALAAAVGMPLDAREAALFCQSIENYVVGAPCGAMDQLTSACGSRGRLLQLLCQPANVQGTPALPDDLALFGIDSGQRHAVSGPAYGRVRAAASMGYRLLAEAQQAQAQHSPARRSKTLRPAKKPSERPADPTSSAGAEALAFGGYLANVTPSELDGGLLRQLPEAMLGSDFLSKYGSPIDGVSAVRPDETYPVRVATEHPIREHFRVRLFAEMLESKASPLSRELLGELMYQSHAAYTACGLGASGTDRLVELVRRVGVQRGLYGAKISGGGCGGTVVVLARAGSEPAIEEVVERYATETRTSPVVFSGSSAGAAELGTICIPGSAIA